MPWLLADRDALRLRMMLFYRTMLNELSVVQRIFARSMSGVNNTHCVRAVVLFRHA